MSFNFDDLKIGDIISEIRIEDNKIASITIVCDLAKNSSREFLVYSESSANYRMITAYRAAYETHDMSFRYEVIKCMN